MRLLSELQDVFKVGQDEWKETWNSKRYEFLFRKGNAYFECLQFCRETSKRCTGVFKAADRVAHKNLRRLVKMKSFEPSWPDLLTNLLHSSIFTISAFWES